MYFDHLPTELYDAILSQVPSSDLQATTLAVSRAIPLSPVRISHLFRSVRIVHPEQAIHLYRRLRQGKVASATSGNEASSDEDQPASWVREISVESWIVDPEVLINVLRMLSRLQSLNLCVGPNNFAPEHLEEVFSRPFPHLQYLALRFRPYVQRANYYQFLKGAYFDSALLALARWPSSILPTVSIVQDPFHPEPDQKQSFAQPIVFFRLDLSLSALLHSSSLSPSLTALRLRIPSRPVARAICGLMTSGTAPYPSDVAPPPNLEFLDLSTCGVLEGEVDMMLVRFPTLKHLVLDGCSILRGELREGDWNVFGKRCALAGVRRAKEREKTLRAWVEASQVSAINAGDANPANIPRRKKGRKGLATATISLRDSGPASSSTPVILDSPISQVSLKRASKIRILPAAPSLVSLAITLSPSVNPENYATIRAEFEAGWAEGVATLAVIKARLRTSATNGYRIVRTASVDENGVEGPDRWFEDGLESLEDVKLGDHHAFGVLSHDEPDSGALALAAPTLCFAGPSRDAQHEKNCGHSISWNIMQDVQ